MYVYKYILDFSHSIHTLFIFSFNKLVINIQFQYLIFNNTKIFETNYITLSVNLSCLCFLILLLTDS